MANMMDDTWPLIKNEVIIFAVVICRCMTMQPLVQYNRWNAYCCVPKVFMTNSLFLCSCPYFMKLHSAQKRHYCPCGSTTGAEKWVEYKEERSRLWVWSRRVVGGKSEPIPLGLIYLSEASSHKWFFVSVTDFILVMVNNMVNKI